MVILSQIFRFVNMEKELIKVTAETAIGIFNLLWTLCKLIAITVVTAILWLFILN